MKNIDWIKSLDSSNLTDFILYTYKDIYNVIGSISITNSLRDWLDSEVINACPLCGCSAQPFQYGQDNKILTYICPHCGNLIHM